jgi:hypothetical protein
MKRKSTKDNAPPRRVTSKQRKTVPNIPGQFVEPVLDFYNMVALVMMPFDPELSMTMVSPHKAPSDEDPNPPSVNEKCAKAWDEAAQKSESVRRMLDAFSTATVWGALAAAHVPIVALVVKNHTPLGAKFDPAAAMEAMLKNRQTTSD